jgi:hypothetical protein
MTKLFRTLSSVSLFLIAVLVTTVTTMMPAVLNINSALADDHVTETQMITVEADVQNYRGALFVTTSNETHAVLSLRYASSEEADKIISVNDLKAGVSIGNLGGYPFLVLKSPDFDVNEGGIIDLKFIHKLISHKYRQLKFIFSKNAQTQNFETLTTENELFNHLFIDIKRILGIPDSVDSIGFYLDQNGSRSTVRIYKSNSLPEAE